MINNVFVQRGTQLVQKMTNNPKHRKGQPVSRNPLHGVMTDDILNALEKRNVSRAKQMIETMGTKWLAHPDNYVKRKDGKVY